MNSFVDLVCGSVRSVLGSGSVIVCVMLQRLSRAPEVSHLLYSLFLTVRGVILKPVLVSDACIRPF